MSKMDFLKNVPVEPTLLSSLINYKDSMVVSMQLTRNEDFQMMLMAVADGEEVTDEQYPGDTLYYVLDGIMPIVCANKIHIVHTGQCIAMKANVSHAIGGQGPFKILQITIKR